MTEILSDGKAYIAPGCPNALIGRLVEEAGFNILFVSGAGISNTQLCAADMGQVTLTELTSQIHYIVEGTEKIPVIADADTGFGNALNVVRTVRELENAGASAIMLEDQVFPKRCGHFSGKAVITQGEMVGKIKAAVDTREDDNMAIIARTDAIAVYGIEAALERAQAYHEAGADCTFVESPTTIEQLETIGKLPWPQVANMVEGGKTPLIPLNQLDEMGFRIVYYANTANRAAVLAVQKILKHLYDKGDTKEVLDQIITWQERQRLVGLDKFKELEVRYSESD